MADKIGEALRARLGSAQDYDAMEVNFFLRGEPAAETLRSMDAAPGISDPAKAIASIKQRSQKDQKELLGFLGAARREASFVDGPVRVAQAERIESYWVTNAIAAQVTRSLLDRVVEREDVLFAELARYVDVAELLDARAAVARRTQARARRRVRRAAAPADAGPQPTWSVQRINAPLLWKLGLTGEGVLAAVIDTGVNYQHPDLADHMWDGGSTYPKHGYDFDADDVDPMDQQGHGTCSAGIVAGNGREGHATGVAPRATVMALRVGGAESSYWRAFEFAIDRKAQVISMSMTWKYPSNPDYPGWRRACETLLAAGILHANSIGNQGDDLATYPLPYNIATPGNCPPPRLHPLQMPVGGLSSAIACGATDDTDQLASYSGRGPAAWEAAVYSDYPYQGGSRPGLIKPDVCAPGPGTTSCNWRFGLSTGAAPYTSFGGTSAATPHVGGCLVLLAQACLRGKKAIVPARVQEALENTAVRVGGQTRDKENHYGAGRVDVFAAYKYGNTRGWW
jgi:subtilisin family serine protease